MPKVHIVIPVYNHYDLLHQLLGDLLRHEKDNIDTVLIVDDCSTESTVRAGLDWWKSTKLLPIQVISTEENSGFLKTSNLGLRTAHRIKNSEDNDIVILISTDVRIYAKFIPEVKELMSSEKSLVGGVLYAHDTGWNVFDGKLFPYLEGWLLATTLGNWKELEYFDEKYAPSDYEDMDISTTAKQMGYSLLPLNSPALQHMGGGSIGYNDERLKRTMENRDKFGDKWCNDGK